MAHFCDGLTARALAAFCVAIVVCAVLLTAPAAFATDDQAPPDTTQAQPSPETTPDAAAAKAKPVLTDYLYPDLGAQTLIYDGKHFWFKPILAFLVDYTWFEQNNASPEQVGEQADKGELRAGRLGFTVRRKSTIKWELYFTVDYQERRNREKTAFLVYDARLGIPVGPVKFFVGKLKEPIAYELSGLSVLLPQQERILNPFYCTRSYGLGFFGRFAGERITLAAGVYNDWLDTDVSLGENGTNVVGRMTTLAWESTEKSGYLHLGLGYRRAGSDAGVMRFAGRPESNVASRYVDTGPFSADHADQISYELLAARGRFSLLAERIDAWITSPENADPRFSGCYAAVSWMLTGEGRAYVRATGFAGGVIPRSRYGALELVVRYSRLDLTDGLIAGGVLDKWHVGTNWWASTQWKVGLSWGDADLDRGGLLGNTRMVLARLQWLWG